jgi:hypothetical protein
MVAPVVLLWFVDCDLADWGVLWGAVELMAARCHMKLWSARRQSTLGSVFERSIGMLAGSA